MKTKTKRDFHSPFERELRLLEGKARVTPLHLEFAGVAFTAGFSVLFGIITFIIVWLMRTGNSYIEIFIPMAAGFGMFFLLTLDICIRQYPALLRRQRLLVARVKEQLFAAGMMRRFLEQEDEFAEKASRGAAGLKHALASLILPLLPEGLLNRIENYAVRELVQLPEFSHYRKYEGEMELRAAVRLALVEELRREPPAGGPSP